MLFNNFFCRYANTYAYVCVYACILAFSIMRIKVNDKMLEIRFDPSQTKVFTYVNRTQGKKNFYAGKASAIFETQQYCIVCLEEKSKGSKHIR